jgi:iron complex transport system substrate-binding protein
MLKTVPSHKKHHVLAIYFIAACLWLVASSCAQAGIRVQDDRGITHEWATPPARIVTLLPSFSETVCALNACQRLVGVDRYANYPEQVKALPKVGGGLDPSIEAVVALKPDVVLMSTATKAAARLEALGIKVVALNTQQHIDVQRLLAVTARLLGLESQGTDAQPSGPVSQRVWQDLQAGVKAAAQSLPAKTTKVYFEVSSAPYAASASSFIGETLTLFGMTNVVPGTMGPFPKINPEMVVRADPDVIMLSETNLVQLQQRPGWAQLRAVRTDKVCVFTAVQSDLLVRPGPRLAEAANLMAQCLKDKLT